MAAVAVWENDLPWRAFTWMAVLVFGATASSISKKGHEEQVTTLRLSSRAMTPTRTVRICFSVGSQKVVLLLSRA